MYSRQFSTNTKISIRKLIPVLLFRDCLFLQFKPLKKHLQTNMYRNFTVQNQTQNYPVNKHIIITKNLFLWLDKYGESVLLECSKNKSLPRRGKNNNPSFGDPMDG